MYIYNETDAYRQHGEILSVYRVSEKVLLDRKRQHSSKGLHQRMSG
jgi:hypothetical protein